MGDVALLLASLGAIALGVVILRAVRAERERQRAIRAAFEQWQRDCLEELRKPLTTTLTAPRHTMLNVSLGTSVPPTREMAERIRLMLAKPEKPEDWN